MAEPDQAAAGAPDGSNAKGKQPDMQEALDAELSALRKPHGKATELWHWERANVNGLVWVTLNSRRAQPTPSQVVQAAATEADKNKECMSRQAGAGCGVVCSLQGGCTCQWPAAAEADSTTDEQAC